MNFFVAVTDYDWFQLHASNSGLKGRIVDLDIHVLSTRR